MKRMLLCLILSFLAVVSAIAQETPKPMANQSSTPESDELKEELIKQAEEFVKRFKEGFGMFERFADRNPPVLAEPQAVAVPIEEPIAAEVADEPKAELIITKRETPAKTEPTERELLQEMLDFMKRQQAPVTPADVEALLAKQAKPSSAKEIAGALASELKPASEMIRQMNERVVQIQAGQLSAAEVRELTAAVEKLGVAINVVQEYQRRHPSLTKDEHKEAARELKREEEVDEMKSHNRQKAMEAATLEALRRHDLEKAAAARKHYTRLRETQHVAESAADRVIEAVGNEGAVTRSHVTSEVEEAEEVVREEAQATREQIDAACTALENYLKSKKPEVVKVTVAPPPHIIIRTFYHHHVPIRYSWWYSGSRCRYFVWR